MLCPLCGESIRDDVSRCGSCGYVLSITEESARASLPPPEQRPARALPTLTSALPIVVVEQTEHEPYWAAAPSPLTVATEVRQAALLHRRVERQAESITYAAVLAAAAALVSMVPVVVDVEAAVAVPAAGRYHLVDLFTNNIGAVVVAAMVLVVGAALRTRSERVGVGLAGGAGVALAAFVGFQYGRARVIEAIVAADATGGASTHYELGTWVLLAAGALGLVTAGVAIAPVDRDTPRRRTDLPIAIAGILGTLALTVGPLIPVDGAELADNWSTDVAPVAFVVARLAVLGALLLTGLVGFASRRLWGVGFALGGMSIAGWQWLSSFGQIGDGPAGVGGRNPIATESVPHVVTTVGFAVALLAGVAALIRSRHAPPA